MESKYSKKKQKKGPERGGGSGGGRRQCRDCHICSVLGVGNGRESITVEPFLQIMTPARKGTGAPMHKHSQPTLEKYARICWILTESLFLATTKWWWPRENLSAFAHSKFPHVAHFDEKRCIQPSATLRPPTASIPQHCPFTSGNI